MKSALLILTLGVLAAFGQQSTVIGSISRLAGAEFVIRTPTGLFTIYATERTEVLKGQNLP
jgi:hypothetical protein